MMRLKNDAVDVFVVIVDDHVIVSLHMIWWSCASSLEPWLQGLARGFVKCMPSPEPYKAFSTAQLGSGFQGSAAGA